MIDWLGVSRTILVNTTSRAEKTPKELQALYDLSLIHISVTIRRPGDVVLMPPRDIPHTQSAITAPVSYTHLLTGAGLMGLMLKDEKDKLTVQFKGDGPAREILATEIGRAHV